MDSKVWNKDFDNISLAYHLENSVNHIKINSPLLLPCLYNSSFNELNFIVQKLLIERKPEILISYGVNNPATSVMINELLNYNKLNSSIKGLEVKKIHFNAFIHSTEDYVFNKLIEDLELKQTKGNFDSNLSTVEKYFTSMKKNLDKNQSTFNDEIKLSDNTSKNVLNGNITNNKLKNKQNLNKKIQDNTEENIDNNKVGFNPNRFIIIYFSNIEHLFIKKKQTLFYTLLEILNNSCNTMFVGMTNAFNLIDLMEKRVRSRFSNKIFQVTITKKLDILGTLGLILNTEWYKDYDKEEEIKKHLKTKEDTETKFKMNDTVNDAMSAFKLIIFENKEFNEQIYHYFNLGLSGASILSKIKFILTNILFEIKKRLKVFVEKYPNYKYDDDIRGGVKLKKEQKLKSENISSNELYFVPISFDEIQLIVKSVISDFINSESLAGEYRLIKGKIYYILFLKIDFPKIHIISLISLYVAKKKCSEDKVNLNLIYNEYLDYCKKYSQSSKIKLDLLQLKKKLEELKNSNIIHVKYDDKLIELYQLKFSDKELMDTLLDLYKENNQNKGFKNIDFNMKKWLDENPV
jgi:hypothetical protein